MTALTCKTHPRAAAEFECVPCGVVLCRACTRLLRDGKTVSCLRCGGLVLPFTGLGKTSTAPQRAEAARPLLERLPGTLAYLKQPAVIFVMLGLAIFVYVGSFSTILSLVAAGTLAAVVFRIVETSAYGDDRLEPPDFTDLWESVMSPLVRYLATVLPLIVALFAAGLGWAGTGMMPSDLLELLGPWAIVVVVWLLLWPLLIMVAAITRSTLAVYDPRVWFRVLRDMRGDYVLGALGFYAAFLLDVFVLRPLAIFVALRAPIPVLVPILFQFIELMLIAWRSRILGEACRPYVDL
ncbi:MAG TPA: B-box zinc finger protein [Haliangiales bacterium]|nr:B-box zinc finger protein [Haliangiales bacterium]